MVINPKKAKSPVYGERHPANLFKGGVSKKLSKRDKELQKRYNKLKEDVKPT